MDKKSWRRYLRLILHLMTSICLGFALMFPLGWLFGKMNWPVFHSWGLVHGAFMIAWPLLTVFSWWLIWAIFSKGARK
jgi:hypothetical protein